jgi:hypothetical protein
MGLVCGVCIGKIEVPPMIKQMNPHNCDCIPTQFLLASLSIIGKYQKTEIKRLQILK